MSRAFHPFTLPNLRKVSEGDTHFTEKQGQYLAFIYAYQPVD